MSAQNAHGRHSHPNIGLERSTPLQNMHEARQNRTPSNVTRSPSMVHRVPDRRNTRFYDRSRSPFNRGSFPDRGTRPRSPEDRIQSHCPPEISGSGAGRFRSPGSVRHKFFRESHENQRSPDDRYMVHGPSPHSPHDGFGARYESCDPQSPMSDRCPDHFTRRARVLSSPDTRRERTEDHNGTFMPDETRGPKRTIDFDGLRDVPVGPRLSFGKIEAKDLRPDIRSPYILIPPERVPPLSHLTRHLQRMIKAQSPKDVIVNNHGWYLIYDNSTNGRLKLKRCYHEFHKKMFFDYELDMQCFLDGTETGNRQDKRTRTSLEGNGNAGNPSTPRPSAKSSPKTSRFAGREISYPDPVRKSRGTHSRELPQQENNNALKDTPSHILKQDLPRHLSAEVYAYPASPVNANVSMLSQRSERDDTASQASGITRSDSSRIKCDKCHVCSGETGHGLSSLVPCSSCRRKYHRLCHQDPAIPDELDDDHAWSCRSCIRKGRTHKGRQQGKSVKPVSNLGPLPSERSSPVPALLNTDGEFQRGRSDAPASQGVKAQESYDAQVNVTRSGLNKAQITTNHHLTAELNTEVVLEIANGDLTLSDPDDLVEKSFSATANLSHTKPQCQKPGKFKITRTKLPPPVQDLKAQETRFKELPIEFASPRDLQHAQAASKDRLKDINTGLPAARNSVADLRALAHKAHETHQSTIRNGTGSGPEGYVESKEQQSHEDHSGGTTKSSSVEQPIVQSGPHQTSQDVQSDAIACTAPTRVVQLEIPESPDEVRLGSVSRVEAAQDPRLPTKHTRVSSGPSDGQTLDASPVSSAKYIASKKSKGPSFSCCSACQKRIPAGPSGMNRLCFGCKKKTAATETPQAVEASLAPGATERAIADVVPPTDEQRVAPPEETEHVRLVAQIDAGEQGEQSVTTVQPHGSTDQASPAPPSTKQTQPTGVGEEDEALHMIVEDGDAARKLAGPVGEAATTYPEVSLDAPLADRSHVTGQMTEPPADITSEHRNSTALDTVDNCVATTPQERVAYIQSIVGDAYDRPKGSRTILIAMAMSTLPTRRMQAKDVLDWISANIPTCKAGVGNWHERVVSQLSQGSRTKSGGDYWLAEEWKEGDGGVPGKRWYELLPEKVDEMWTWCPVRQQPVAPKQPAIAKPPNLKRQRGSKSMEGASALRRTLSIASVSTPTTPLATEPSTAINSTNGLSSSKQGSTTVTSTSDRSAMDLDDSSNTNAIRATDERKAESVAARRKGPRATPEIEHASSDDEPLLKKRRRDALAKSGPLRHADMQQQQHTPANTEMEELPDAGDEAADVTATICHDGPDVGPSNEASNPLAPSKKAKVVILNMRKGSLSDSLIKLSTRDSSVKSFYGEWPEYRSENMFDEQVKLAEISKRPTRKQMFGRPAPYSRIRLGEPSEEVPVIPVNASPEKRAKVLIDPNNPYPWENPDADRALEEFKTLDEFFDFPANMIPIISEGQLAYRDGTRNDDGRLPRAREVFKA